MKKFPKDEKARRISNEWAQDFKQTGMLQEFLLWYAVSLAFEIGGIVEEDAVVAEINRAIQVKMKTASMTALFPKSMRGALAEISKEAKYLQSILSCSPD